MRVIKDAGQVSHDGTARPTRIRIRWAEVVALMGMTLAVAVVGIWLIDASVPASTSVDLPACVTEDSTNCYRDGGQDGP